MSKYIQIDSPTGQYNLPLRIVAEDRAKYYTDEEFDDEPDPERDQYHTDLVAQYLADGYADFENIDWLQDNMEWDRVKLFAKRVHHLPCCKAEDFWDDWQTMRIVEINDTGQLELEFTNTLPQCDF